MSTAVVDLARVDAGFADPVRDAQACFRALLDAMARPGAVRTPALAGFRHPAPVGAALAAVLATLADAQTPVWLSPMLTGSLADFARFHTGCPIVATPAQAMFAFAKADDVDGALLEALPRGSELAPQDGATLVIDIPAPLEGTTLAIEGPGIETTATLPAGGLAPAFWRARAELTASFPCGVDLVLCHGAAIRAVPRSTRVSLPTAG